MTTTKKIHIATLLTCHNRREKTTRCLLSLQEALASYNNQYETKIAIEVFLTDDGCTDGTVEAAKKIFNDESTLHIIQGDGKQYWAGGMRMCWQEAQKKQKEWNYYLLLNDDVVLTNNVFSQLFSAEHYANDNFSNEGIISGITCDPNNMRQTTYGGSKWINKILFTHTLINPSGNPQPCDLANANILLVPVTIVEKIGIFHAGYQHGIADYDYSNTARKQGIPVILTANYCGLCEHDHNDYETEKRKVLSMSLKEREKYFNNPIRSSKDYIRFIKRTSPIRLPLVWFGRTINIYLPSLYYTLNKLMRR